MHILHQTDFDYFKMTTSFDLLHKSIKAADLKISLFEQRTLLNVVSCGRLSHPFSWMSYIPCCTASVYIQNGIGYALYLVMIIVLLILLDAVEGLSITPPMRVAHNIFVALVLTSVLLGCNAFVFKEAFVSFEFHYKIINLIIALIAFHIEINWHIPNSSDGAETLLIISGVIKIIHCSEMMAIISLSDGYYMNRIVKIAGIVTGIIYLVLSYYRQLLSKSADNEADSHHQIGDLFGHRFHWSTIGTTCMTSAIIFLVMQSWKTITKPNKLVFIPTFISFSFIDSPNDDRNHITDDITDAYVGLDLDSVSNHFAEEKSIDIAEDHGGNGDGNNDNYSCECAIDRNYTLKSLLLRKLRTLTRCPWCHNCLKRTNQCLFSNWTFAIFVSYFIAFVLLLYCVNTSINAILQITMLIIVDIAMMIILLRYNATIFYFIIWKSNYAFVFWWKVFDAVVLFTMFTIIDKTNDNFVWSFKESAPTMSQRYAIMCLNGIGILLFVISISANKAFVIISRANSDLMSKCQRLIAYLGIVGAISYFLRIGGIYFTHSNRDHGIRIFKHNISCRTLLIAKSADLCIFFISQLYSLGRHGFTGIEVTGYVTKKWISRSH